MLCRLSVLFDDNSKRPKLNLAKPKVHTKLTPCAVNRAP